MKTKRLWSALSLLMVLTMLFAGVGVRPVFAHHSTVSGVVACLPDGTQKITWTIVNSESGKIETVTALNRSIGLTVPFNIAKSGTATGSEIVAGTATGLITLSVTATWPGYGPVTNSGSVTLPGGCTPPTPKKVYVCKYVGSPGVNERLQTGNNPIEVSVNAIGMDPVVIGSYFNDAQGRSYVLGFVPMNPAPTVADCPEPPYNVCSIKVDGTVPEWPAGVWNVTTQEWDFVRTIPLVDSKDNTVSCGSRQETKHEPPAVCTDGKIFNPQTGLCDPPPPVPGCMDETALNYNPLATVDDGSCQYPPEEVPGCMDETALNFNPLATVDDGSCQYTPEPPKKEVKKITCPDEGCTGSNFPDIPEPGHCIAVVTRNDVCREVAGGCAYGDKVIVVLCNGTNSGVRMGGLYFETKPILNSDVPNLNYLITPPGAYHSHWFWLKSGLNPEMNDKEFWTNWQDKVYLTKSSPDYHGGACSLSVFYTVNGGNILLTEGQNSWEAVLFVVETQWGLKKDVDPKLYDRAWDYVDQYFKDNPLTDPDNLTKHFEVPVPAKPDWVP